MCSLLALFLLPTLSHCLTVTYERADLISKSKVELQNTFISCGLNDIAILTAPVTATKAVYYLYKPNQETIKLNFPRPRSKKTADILTVKYINKNVKVISASGNTRVVNPSYRHRSDEDVVKEEELEMRENEFMIGPMLEEDHGNWVLSVYLKDIDDQWIEMFQVISVEITAPVPLTPAKPILKEGDEFHLSFAYPIKNLESCELTVPNSTYDSYILDDADDFCGTESEGPLALDGDAGDCGLDARAGQMIFYDRSPIDMERCGYIVKNVTKADEGLWVITGLGKMVFSGLVFLRVVGDVSALAAHHR